MSTCHKECPRFGCTNPSATRSTMSDQHKYDLGVVIIETLDRGVGDLHLDGKAPIVLRLAQEIRAAVIEFLEGQKS